MSKPFGQIAGVEVAAYRAEEHSLPRVTVRSIGGLDTIYLTPNEADQLAEMIRGAANEARKNFWGRIEPEEPGR